MPFNPIEGTKDIVGAYKRYLLTTFQTNIDTLNQQLDEELSSNNAIANGPFISITKPYQKGTTLKQLIESSNGVLSNTLNDIRPFNKKLYSHQVRAIENASTGKSIVVTTGTSSGKTECFLIPIINQLLKEKEELIKSTGDLNAKLPPGVRTLIIYPLNALVNDQLKRLIFDDDTYDNGELKNIFSYLSEKCPDIKVGMYIGNTPEDKDANNFYKFLQNLSGDKDYSYEDFKNDYPNIVLTRDEMRNEPPHILITNYTMLEYLLLRPTDEFFFDNTETNKYWKTIVLDEAHTYDGALGIEISTLLRRVKARIKNNDVQFILTSATLGDKSENGNILNFANSLCSTKGTSKEFTEDCIIRAEYYDAPFETELHETNFEFYDEFPKLLTEYEKANDFVKEDKLDDIINFLKGYNINVERGEEVKNTIKNIKESLYNYISKDKFYNYLKNEIIQRVNTYTNRIFSNTPEQKSLMNIFKEKWTNITDNDFINFITTSTYACDNEGYNLFEAKYHMFLKGFNGIYVTLEPGNEKLYMTQSDENKEDGNKIFSISFCSNCNALYLIGYRNRDGEGDEYFKQKAFYSEGDIKEIFLLSSNEYDDDDDDENAGNKYWLCTKCGKMVPYSCYDQDDTICEHDADKKVLIIKIDKEPLIECPCCHARAVGRDIFRPYVVGQSIATSVIGTALYRHIPDRYFNQIKRDRKQFLAFSDSRQKAAFFASNMDYSYEKYIKKATMAQVWLKQYQGKSGIQIKEFIEQVYKKFKDKGIFLNYNQNPLESNEKECKKQAYISVIDELIGFSRKDSMLNKGIFYFDININEDSIWDNVTDEEFTTYLKIFVMDLIKKGEIGNILADEDKKNIEIMASDIDTVYTKTFPCYDKDKDLWTKNKKTKKICKNKRIKLLKLLLENGDISYKDISTKLNEISDEEVLQITNKLDDIPKILFKRNILIDEGKNEIRINLDKITVNSIDINTLYKCSECKTVTPYNIRNLCLKSLNHCHGHLEHWTNYEKELENNHYRVLYEKLPLLPLKAEEHTAQLTQDSAKDVQDRFQKGLINVLSCSTTFEMGIDLGSLETVFMRNMPPTTSNYTQRAGRAGRGQDSSAFVLTYCLNRSHDLNYFENPEKMINGKVNPPVFDINNEKIILRHIFASALSFYWKNHKEYYQQKIDKKDVSNIEVFYGKKIDSIKKPMDFDGYRKFKNYILEEKDPKLKEYLFDITKCLDEDLQKKLDIENFGWASALFEEDEESENYPGILYSACYEYIETIDNINDVTNVNYDRASKLKEIINKNTIRYLAENNILPKYGFPVDLVTLYTDNCGALDKVDLQRGLNQAITEYAPDSKVIVKKLLCTSKYVKKPVAVALPKYHYAYCDECGAINISTQGTFLKTTACNCCGSPINLQEQKHFIIPKFGFHIGQQKEYTNDIEDINDIDKKDKITWKGHFPKDAKMQYPEQTYSSDIYYIAHKDKEKEHYYEILENHNKITIISTKSSSAELAILNKSNFYICPLCGYSGILKEDHIPSVHKNLSGKPCEGKLIEGIDRHVNKKAKEQIGHKFFTDAIILEFPSSDIRFYREDEDAKPITSQAISILYALIEGISRALHINRKELDGSLYYYKRDDGVGNFSFVIFDSTPGGAGYVTLLTKNETILSNVLEETYNFVKNCPEGCSEESSCYGCMRNYDNQRYHDKLKRIEVINFLENLGFKDEHDNYHFNITKINKVTPKKVVKQPSYSPIESTSTEDDTNLNDNVLLALDEAQELLKDDSDIIEILEDLQESVDLENSDISFIKSIEEESKVRDIEKPYHLGKLTVGNKELEYTLAWKKSKIIYFREEQYAVYLKARENISGWILCCPKSDNFEPNEIIEAIKEN